MKTIPKAICVAAVVGTLVFLLVPDPPGGLASFGSDGWDWIICGGFAASGKLRPLDWAVVSFVAAFGLSAFVLTMWPSTSSPRRSPRNDDAA